MDGKERCEYQQMGQGVDRIIYEWEKKGGDYNGT